MLYVGIRKMDIDIRYMHMDIYIYIHIHNYIYIYISMYCIYILNLSQKIGFFSEP